jgi:uncharacterized protein (TIGR02118 family)
VQLIVVYKTKADPAAFDRYYRETHVPLGKKIPGLRKFEISRGSVATPTGPSDVHMVAILSFENLAAIQAAFASPEGQAAALDAQSFLGGGDFMLMFDTEEV